MDASAIVYLLVPIVLLIGVRLLLRRWSARPQRGSALGLSASPEDPAIVLAIDFDLFAGGRDGRVEGIFDGTWDGVDVRLFDYLCDVERGPVTGAGWTVRYSCGLSAVPAVLPPLVATREHPGTILREDEALPDLAFELDAFNRAFEVRCPDPRFAHALVDQRMMRFLLATDPAFRFETRGRWLLVSARELAPSDSIALLETLKGFRDHVPRVVYDLYGPSATG